MLSATLVRATPLILTGLSVTLAFTAGVMNIGAEGPAACRRDGGRRRRAGDWANPLALGDYSRWSSCPADCRRGVGIRPGMAASRVRRARGHQHDHDELRRALSRGVSRARPAAGAAPHLPTERSAAGERTTCRSWSAACASTGGFAIAVCCAAVLWWALRFTAAGFRIRVLGSESRRRPQRRVDRRREDGHARLSTEWTRSPGSPAPIEVTGVTYSLYENLSPGYGYTAIAVALVGVAQSHPDRVEWHVVRCAGGGCCRNATRRRRAVGARDGRRGIDHLAADRVHASFGAGPVRLAAPLRIAARRSASPTVRPVPDPLVTDAIGPFLDATIRTATPLALAALGETVVERAGMINIGLEGTIIAGAFGAVAALRRLLASPVHSSRPCWPACCAAVILGILIVTLRADQIVAGTALTLLALGRNRAALPDDVRNDRRRPDDPDGRSRSRSRSCRAVPVIGRALFVQPVTTYVVYVLVPLLAWWLSRTHAGLSLRAVGENPAAAVAAGISPDRVRWLALLFGGALGGLSGGCLVIAQVGTFAEGMSAGRGFIAIAIVALGRWSPLGVAIAALLFGAASALQFAFQSLGWTRAVPALSRTAVPADAGQRSLVSLADTLRRPHSVAGGFVRPDQLASACTHLRVSEGVTRVAARTSLSVLNSIVSRMLELAGPRSHHDVLSPDHECQSIVADLG